MGDAALSTTFGFNFDLSFWQEIFALPPVQLIQSLMAIGGWLILVFIFFYMGLRLWVHYRELQYMHNWQWVVLAVDIPPLFIQTPKAVEQIFAHLSGALIAPNIGEAYWQGKKQKQFSVEIVSIEGYIQFLIRTEIEFRDLVESAVYAQYPEAEITEVEDYVDTIPGRYPNDEYDVFAVEFTLAQPSAYPIRTYPSFEYSLSKDVVFSDPMAALLENFSRIGHGENLWFQIIVKPVDNHWREKGVAMVKEIIEGNHQRHKSIIETMVGDPLSVILHNIKGVLHWNFEPMEHVEEEVKVGKVTDLSPGKKDMVEKVEEKISKLGFKTKILLLYSARKDVYSPRRCIDGVVGSVNQFHVLGSNALVPHKATIAHYAFKNQVLNAKKNRMVFAYKNRLLKAGGNPFILNIEELATIWHFPLPFVKTPLVQKAAVKRGEPPMGLPVESSESPLKKITTVAEARAKAAAVPPPPPPPVQYG